MKAPIQEATVLVQKGHLDAARNLLEQFLKAYPAQANQQVGALLYFIYRGMDDVDNAIHTCNQQLSLVDKDLPRSTWLLRRGLLKLRANHEVDALGDFEEVIQMNCSSDHVSQAQKSISEANLKVN